LPVLSLAILIVLFLIRRLVPERARGFWRAGIFFAAAYPISLALIGLLASPTRPGSEELSRVLPLFLFCFSLVIAASVVVFDVILVRRAIPRILRDILQGVAFLVAALFVLSRASVDVSKVFTASVLTTAVIGLALQDTLGNLLAGLALELERDIDVGDWVRVDDKVTGRIVEVRWRVTALLTKNGDLLLLPNALMARSQLVNFSRPTTAHRQWIYLRVHFRHPPARVREVILHAVKKVAAVEADPAPDCIVWDFKEDAMTYAIRYWIREFERDDSVDGEVRAMIWYAMHRAGMEIPFPSRNIHVTEMTEGRAQRKLERSHAELVTALAGVDVFRTLEAAHIERLAQRVRVDVFGPGETILRQGEPGDSLYIVRRGCVAVRVSSSRGDAEIAELGEGQFFGEMSLMTGASRSATVAAKTDVECYVVSKDAFRDIIETQPGLATSISEILSRRRDDLSDISQRIPLATTPGKPELLARIGAFFGLKP
jgi:small-conductance mechanosensitive channel